MSYGNCTSLIAKEQEIRDQMLEEVEEGNEKIVNVEHEGFLPGAEMESLTGKELTRQEISMEDYIVINRCEEAGEKWLSEKDGAMALQHIFFEAGLYRSNLAAFTDRFVRTNYFAHMPDPDFTILFNKSVKFLIGSVEKEAADDQYTPVRGARLLYLGKKNGRAIGANDSPTLTNLAFRDAFINDDNKVYHAYKVDEGSYEIAVKLFPRNDCGDIKEESIFNPAIIGGCTYCHSSIKRHKYEYKTEDIAGALVIKFSKFNVR